MVGKISTGKAFRNQTHPNSRIFASIYLKSGAVLVGLAGLLPHTSPHIFMHIEERGKSLIICWRFEGTKYHKTLKKHNNPISWSNAKLVMAAIENDIDKERFDPSLYTKEGKVANSIVGGKEVQSWRSTANGLEAIATAHNHILLPIDELGQGEKSVGEAIYI
jgi:hypothetical protein